MHTITSQEWYQIIVHISPSYGKETLHTKIFQLEYFYNCNFFKTISLVFWEIELFFVFM